MKVVEIEGVWARNLLANRIYEASVIFLEPYIANSEEVYQRLQMVDSDYGGNNDNQRGKSIVKEYVDAVLLGLEEAGR